MFMLFKRSNGYYYLKYLDVHGIEQRVSTKAKIKRDALKFISQFKIQLEKKSKEISLNYNTAKEKYLKHCKINFSAKYHQIMKESLDKFGDYIGDIQLRDIVKDDCQTYISEKYKTAKYSAHLQFRNLRTFFNWCVDNEYLEVAPTNRIKPPKLPEKKPLWITEDEFKLISAKVENTELIDIYSLLFYTGMRANELLRLEWGNIDLHKKLFHIRNSESFTTKSGGERDIPMSEKSFQIINRQKSRFTGGYLFTKNHKNYNVDYVSKQFKKALRETNLNSDIHLHTLRHSFASNLVQRGVSLSVIQKLLGHANYKTTERYSHLQNSNLIEAINLLNVSIG